MFVKRNFEYEYFETLLYVNCILFFNILSMNNVDIWKPTYSTARLCGFRVHTSK